MGFICSQLPLREELVYLIIARQVKECVVFQRKPSTYKSKKVKKTRLLKKKGKKQRT